ncbi:hypothetical protein ACTMBH_27470 [Klebsiella pneumoniae]|uniref:hypothetical protein n=1 Tax=Klebsiella pneumoniae TaxID=573 RepID=UPI003F8D1343
MTSKFNIDNRELLQRISSGEAVVGIDFGNLIVRELAAFRLAAMDSEPVTVPEHITYISEPTILNILANDDSSSMANAARLLAYEVRFWRSFPLYRHAQPAPVVPEEMTPEMMRSVQLNSELGAYAASNLSGAYDLFAEFWKEACRAAMLAAAPQEAK